MSKDTPNKIKVDYPEIREMLKELHSSAYISGENSDEKESKDSIDYSTIYEKIEEYINKKVIKKL